MEKSLFRFIWRFSSRQQMVILLITIVSYPVTYILLELPKLIVNDAIQGENFPRAFYGMEFDQVSYLVLLCFTFLGLVVDPAEDGLIEHISQVYTIFEYNVQPLNIKL